MNASEQQVIQLALNQIEAVIRDLHWGSPNGYVMGYELGYMKGVLEHVLRTHPDIQTRGPYLQGYVNGYNQGLLYLVRCNAIERPQGARRGVTRRSLAALHRQENEIREVSQEQRSRSLQNGVNGDHDRGVSTVEQTHSIHNGSNENLVRGNKNGHSISESRSSENHTKTDEPLNAYE